MVIVYPAVFFATSLETPGGTLLWNLNTGVWVFFVTSAFLLYRPFAAAHLSSTPSINLGGYALRRVARIYPAYWAVLAFFLFVVPKARIFGTDGYLLNLTLTQTYARMTNPFLIGLPPAWSLVVELTFYAFLPLYAAVIGRAARRWTPRGAELNGVIALMLLGVASLVAVGEGYDAPWIGVLPIHLPAFALGILLAAVSTAGWSAGATTRLAKMGRAPWLWWSLALAAFVAIPVVIGDAPFATLSTAQIVGRGICQALLGVFVVIPAVLGPQDRGGVRRLLRSRPLAWLGLISYGLYLWHWFILLTVQGDWLGWRLREGNWVVVLLTALPLVIAAAAASWYALERPILRGVHSLTRARRVASSK